MIPARVRGQKRRNASPFTVSVGTNPKKVGCRFVARACQIAPDEAVGPEDAKGVTALGRNIDMPVQRRRAHEIDGLLLDEGFMSGIEAAELLGQSLHRAAAGLRLRDGLRGGP